MTHNQHLFYIARLVLETCTPLSIATGRTDGLADNLIVRDANGLPAIPGSSLAGVLRHAYQRFYDKDGTDTNTNQLFGSGKDENETGNPSFVHISWGCLHDCNDKPIEDLLDTVDSRWKDDEILTNALQPLPVRRDHVKLNHRGVSDAEKQGKFERTSLTTGHRFSVELSLWSSEENDQRWTNLLDLLQRPNFRLGGGTRRGLGKLKIVRCSQGQFNLTTEDQFNQFRALTQSLADTTQLTELSTSEPQAQITVQLTPLDGYGYRFGGGVEPLIKDSQANLLAVTEQCVEWENDKQNDKGRIAPTKKLLIPASGVKGALSHRIAYHYNALTNTFADDEQIQQQLADYVGENNEAIKALFGYVIEKEKDENDSAQLENDKESAQMGCLIFDDVYLERTNQLQVIEYPHNGVDRFTGGVREGVLFSEEVVTSQQSFSVNIAIVLPSNNNQTWNLLKEHGKDNKVWEALQRALNDLVEGRLALGAGGGRGHGYFKGKWTTDNEWLSLNNIPLSPSKKKATPATLPNRTAKNPVTVQTAPVVAKPEKPNSLASYNNNSRYQQMFYRRPCHQQKSQYL
jgi:CRISPR/Cas system CMR subunit Cmr4 (Cas7 group RAMP superfamily)